MKSCCLGNGQHICRSGLPMSVSIRGTQAAIGDSLRARHSRKHLVLTRAGPMPDGRRTRASIDRKHLAIAR